MKPNSHPLLSRLMMIDYHPHPPHLNESHAADVSNTPCGYCREKGEQENKVCSTSLEFFDMSYI